jgi:hypothetical protein
LGEKSSGLLEGLSKVNPCFAYTSFPHQNTHKSSSRKTKFISNSTNTVQCNCISPPSFCPNFQVHICPFCGKSYSQALYLDKHMTKHTADRRSDVIASTFSAYVPPTSFCLFVNPI